MARPEVCSLELKPIGDAQVTRDGLGEVGVGPPGSKGSGRPSAQGWVGCGLGSQEGQGALEGLHKGAVGCLLLQSSAWELSLLLLAAWPQCHTWEAPIFTIGRGALYGLSATPWLYIRSRSPQGPSDVSPTIRSSRTHLLELIFLNIVSGWGLGSLVHL